MADKTLAHAVARLAETVRTLDQRLAALEERHADIQRKAEAVNAASKAWKAQMRVQGDVLLANDMAETCRVPLAVLRPLLAGRPLDLELREGRDDMVELVDHGARVLARLPRLALLALPKIVASPELAKLLTSTTTPGVASRSCASRSPATRSPHSPPPAELRATGHGSRGCMIATAPSIQQDQEGQT